MTDDLRRFVDRGSEAPYELQRLLESARRDVPSSDQLKQLATRLGPAIGAGVLAGASSSAATPAATALKSGTALKVMLASAVVASVGLGVAVGFGGGDSIPTLGHPARVGRPLIDVKPPSAAATTPAPEPALQAEAPPEPSTERQRPASPSEAQLLQQAQAMLKTDPARALALTRTHKQRFGNGALAQEREVIAIEAMRRLGQKSDAERRADEFRRDNPDSAHLPRIERTTPKP